MHRNKRPIKSGHHFFMICRVRAIINCHPEKRQVGSDLAFQGQQIKKDRNILPSFNYIQRTV